MRLVAAHDAGLSREQEDQTFELEASQGDRIVGIISRQEVASVAAAALDSPAAAGTIYQLNSAVLEMYPVPPPVCKLGGKQSPRRDVNEGNELDPMSCWPSLSKAKN